MVGVGLIGFWNRPGHLAAIYGTDAMMSWLTWRDSSRVAIG